MSLYRFLPHRGSRQVTDRRGIGNMKGRRVIYSPLMVAFLRRQRPSRHRARCAGSRAEHSSWEAWYPERSAAGSSRRRPSTRRDAVGAEYSEIHHFREGQPRPLLQSRYRCRQARAKSILILARLVSRDQEEHW